MFDCTAAQPVPPFGTGSIPVTSDVRSTDVPSVDVSTPPVFVSPLPSSDVNDEPPRLKLVVDAVVNDAYVVDE